MMLESYVEAFSPIEGQVGALFAIEGEIAGLDLFDAPETFQKLFPKLLRSYGLDALNRARQEETKPNAKCTPAKANDFLERLSKAKAEEFPAVGEGTDIRLSSQNLNGAALIVDDRIVHLCAHLQPEPENLLSYMTTNSSETDGKTADGLAASPRENITDAKGGSGDNETSGGQIPWHHRADIPF